MYNKVHDEVLEGLISAALNEYIETENKKVPDDEQLSKMYPLSKKEKRWLKRKTKEKKHNKPLVLVYLSRAAVIFLCIVSLSVAVLMTNSGVRAAVADAVVTWYEDHVRFDFSKSEDVPEDTQEGEKDDIGVEDMTVGYIPEGFEEASRTEDSGYRQYIYYNENGEHLLIVICDSKNTEMEQDSEQHEYEEIILNGNIKAHLFYNDEERSGTIIYGNNVYTVDVTGIIDKDELIKVAENILPKDSGNADGNYIESLGLEIGYIPKGFELSSSTEDTNLTEYIYTSENGDYLIISICATETTEVFVDAEASGYEKISINGNDAYILYSDADRAGTLVAGNSVYTIMISSISERSDIIKVAESIK